MESQDDLSAKSSPSPRSTRQAMLRFSDAPDPYRKGQQAARSIGMDDLLFEQAMAQTRMAVCLCDPHAKDAPIVYANRAFQELTGYSEEEIVGRNCRFLQGDATDLETVETIRQALAKEEVVVVELLNYRKDRSTFWNALHLGPIYDEDGKLKYYFGSQWDVSDLNDAEAQERKAQAMGQELAHRMKNLFAVLSGIVNMTGRVHDIRKEAGEINERIQALGRAYETTLDDVSRGAVNLGEAIRAVLEPYDGTGERLIFRGNGARMPFGVISLVSLVLHELAANASKYGAWTQDEGVVEVDWGDARSGENLVIRWSESGGPVVDASTITPGHGTAIVDRILQTVKGRIERQWNQTGFSAVIHVPLQEMR
jgi:PAS domain S-box-containing protein